jgi:hypothetical protein
VQGFLHVLDVSGAVAQEHIALTGDGAEAADLFGRAEGGSKQSVAVELLEPLAIEDIGLFARDVLHMAGINEADLDAGMLEDVIQRNPVDAGGFHGHTTDVTRTEPVGKLVQIPGERREGPDRFAVAIRRDGDVDFGRADINAGNIGVDSLESLRYNGFTVLRGSGSHGNLRSCCRHSIEG